MSVQISIGQLVVSGWERNEVSVEIVRRGADAQQLARLPADVQQGSGGIVVRAIQTGDGRDPGLRSDVTVRMPALAELRDVAVFEGNVELSDLRRASSVRVERGDIQGTRVSGALRLETAMGHIRLAAATLAEDGMMHLRTFNGDVTLELAQKPLHARILALSMGGTIRSEIPLALKDRWGPRFGEATLGNGEPVVSIDVVNGNVAITVAAAGR